MVPPIPVGLAQIVEQMFFWLNYQSGNPSPKGRRDIGE
jgi:hypothetical protein